MTKEEYQRKRDFISTSDADVDTKSKALARLTEDYIGAQMRATQLMYDSAPESPKGID